MESLATLPRSNPRQLDEPRIQVLLADADPGLRSFMASCVRDTVETLAVLEAADGAEAIQIGLQRRPQIALLDVDLPRLGGIEVASVLRQLQPQMRLALHTADPLDHCDRARDGQLPLFDKLQLDRALAWLELQVRSCARRPDPLRKHSLECAMCGYGIARLTPPDRCPMCQGEDTWIHTPWRPFAVDRAAV